MGRNSALENFQGNIKPFFLILSLLCFCTGMSSGKIFVHTVLLRLSIHCDGWQTPGLRNADGLLALPRQMVNLRGPDLSASICF